MRYSRIVNPDAIKTSPSWVHHMENLLYWAGMSAVAVNALTGVLDAGRKHMDLIGVVMVGAATALGGHGFPYHAAHLFGARVGTRKTLRRDLYLAA